MKTLLGTFAAAALAMTVGCTQSNPGGPGVSTTPNTQGGTTTVANKPLIGEAEETFKMNTPMLATRVKQGESTTAKISVSRGKNFDEDVALKFIDVPKGVTLTPVTPMIAKGDKEATIDVQAAADAAIGEFTVKVAGHPEKGPDATSELKLTILEK
jgi:uncharacterized membrane protein